MPEEKQEPQRRLPEWLRVPSPVGPGPDATRRALSGLGLNTVCNEARCPNLGECFASQTATFMILGKVCTRQCRFCGVPKGGPDPLDLKEPERVAKAAEVLGMKHVVITSVTRDDLPDQGALQFLATIQAVAKALPRAGVEVLTPDFQGNVSLVELVSTAPVRVFAHNLETVPSLYPKVRPGAEFERSLEVLRAAKKVNPSVFTKTGFMLGLGETLPELFSALKAAKDANVDMVTLGQYLRPSKKQLPVERFFPPEEFREVEKKVKALGFRSVIAGPLVRSSYMARQALEQLEQAGGA